MPQASNQPENSGNGDQRNWIGRIASDWTMAYELVIPLPSQERITGVEDGVGLKWGSKIQLRHKQPDSRKFAAPKQNAPGPNTN